MDSRPYLTGDIRYAAWLESFAPVPPVFMIYSPIENEYIKYNSRSEKSDFSIFSTELDEFVVFGNVK